MAIHPIYRMQIRQWSLGILAIVAIAAFIYYSNFGFSTSKNHRSEAERTVDDQPLELGSSETAFKLILEKSDVDELFVLSNELANERNQQLAVRLDRLAKRLKIVERILELRPGEAERDKAILAKLDVLMEWETLAQVHDFATTERSASLRSIAKDALMVGAAPLAMRAQAGLALAAISEFLDASPSEKRTALADEALRQFQSAVEANRENFDAAKSMLDWIQIIQDETGVEDTSRFLQAFDAFDSSSNGEVKELVSAARKKHVRTDINLEDFLSSNLMARDALVARLVQQVESSLDAPSVSESALLFILERAADLLVLAKTEEAQQIHDKVQRSAASVESTQLSEHLIEFGQRIALFNKPFDLSSIKSQEDQPASLRVTEAKFRILFFVSARNRQESVSQFMVLLKSLRKQLASSRVELALVFVEYGNDRKVLDSLKEFASEGKHWQLWKLNPATEAGQEFLGAFPITSTPYLVVLDQANQVVSLGPSLQIIEEIVVRNK